MLHVDVIVVGAGPAGAVAAQRLAASGVQVALLDQATFPRDKPCGDGVMAEGLTVLERSGLAAWLTQFQVMEMLRLTSPDGQVLDIDLRIPDEPIGRLIPRRRLDARLAQTAVEAGVHLMEGLRVRQVRLQAAAPLEVVANGFTLTAQIVILADGSHAPITHSLGLVRERPELLAIRQYLVGDG
ncbi:MAG: FAD-dependent monooxygenase, partial [Anaerolineae bacterium]|nr:FAD-dependent monooxygenase [Anaerolineae bacterium]